MTVERSAAGARAPITVHVNGERRSLDAPVALDALVAALAGPAPAGALPPGPGAAPAGPGIAAAVNEAVVPRSRWAATLLRDGDRVEILTAVQGG
jgi:sulfur carrier protein